MEPSFSLSRCVTAALLAALLTACQSSNGPPVPVKSPQQLRTLSAPYKGQTIDALVANQGAMKVARELYAANCASCHEMDGHGSRDVMDLVAGRFNYGASAKAIYTTISQGRTSNMPSMSDNRIGEVDVGQLVEYVESLSSDSDEPPSLYEQTGEALFQAHCASCHGKDGKGITAMGAADLTDSYWLHGDSQTNIRLVITRGETAVSPAYQDKLSRTQMNLLTAYVLNLRSQPSKTERK